MPTYNSKDRLRLILNDLREALTNKDGTELPFNTHQSDIHRAIQALSKALQLPRVPTAKPMRPTQISATTTANARPDTQRIYRNGTIIRKRFNQGWYEGEVTGFDPQEGFYKITYTDGDTEEMTSHEVKAHRKRDQRYHGRVPRVPDTKPEAPHRAYIAGSIWDATLNKWMPYRDLIRHPEPHTRALWLRSGENEFGRLTEGFKDITGMQVLEWITKEEIPPNKTPTYPRYTVAYRPEKDEKERTRITAGGDRLEYEGITTTHTASMETIKIHINSVLSTPGAKWCSGDISNMYLESTLPDPQYVKFRLSLIPPAYATAYELQDIADQHGNVYARIKKAWYGLKESGKIAHDDLVQHLERYGYRKARHTEGLFTHITRSISFTLVVDDFGIKYIDKADVDYLIRAINSKYKFKVDWEGKQYVGMHLQWDYDQRQVKVSMDGYLQEALKEFQHEPPKQVFHSPSKMEPPDYGSRIQYAPTREGQPLTEVQKQYIRKITGKFLFYARAVDMTMLHALNELARATNKGTTETLQAAEYLLNYATSNPSASILYQASDMQLIVDSDAAYLVCDKAHSRAGGYHFLTDQTSGTFNGPVYVMAKVIKNVMASAAEAEVCALFMNAQEVVAIRNCLEDLGHPQGPTTLRTDSSTAQGILQGTMKQKKSKAMDMRYHWLKDRVGQGQLLIHWIPGSHNLADYPTKHHSPAHHCKVRPIYTHIDALSPSTLQGCIKVLEASKNDEPSSGNKKTSHTSSQVLEGSSRSSGGSNTSSKSLKGRKRTDSAPERCPLGELSINSMSNTHNLY